MAQGNIYSSRNLSWYNTSGASGLLHYVVVGHRAGNHMILIVIMNLVLVHEHWNDMLGAHKQTPIAK